MISCDISFMGLKTTPFPHPPGCSEQQGMNTTSYIYFGRTEAKLKLKGYTLIYL